MGIKSINQFLKEKGVPCFIDKYPLSNFNGHRIAIDAANWCYMFMAGEHRDTVYKTRNIVDNQVDRESTLQKLYNKFLQFNILLMQNGIIPVWCWDGTAHDEKGPEREKRRKARNERDTKIKDLKEKVEAVPAWLRNAKNLGTVPEEMRLAAIEYKEKENELKKLMSTQIFVSYDEMNNIRAIAEGLGIPSIIADHEGEMLCAQLAVKGKVSGVWSADTDNYAMGTPILITGFDGYGQGRSTLVKVVSVPYILKSLEISQEQLLDLCIMCGCDYNNNIKNYGPKKSFDLLKSYNSIESVIDHLKKTDIDTSCLKYEVCRDYLKPKDIIIDINELNIDTFKFNKQGRDLLHSFSLEDTYDDVKSGIEKVSVKPLINFVKTD